MTEYGRECVNERFAQCVRSRSRTNCPISPWRKLPACGRKPDRKLEAYAIYFSNGADVVHRAGTKQRCQGGRRLGFKGAKELNPLFQNELIQVPPTVEHALDKNLLFCQHLGCAVEEGDYFMAHRPEDDKVVESFLDNECKDRPGPLIYANPAARWQSKHWPAEHWAILADRMAEQGMTLLFCGSGGDLKFTQTITSRMQSRPVVAVGRFSLEQTTALLKRCALYIGLDSGPMHMAALCRVPVVALFGPTHPARVGPHGVAHRIVRAEHLFCLECRKRACDHLSCMHDIKPDMVLEAALSLLNRTE